MKHVLRGRIARSHPYSLDKTLSVEGTAAESSAVGNAIKQVNESLKTHADDKENPHNVTKIQVGLGNVDNTSDEEKPVSRLQAEAIAEAKKAGTDAQATADNAQDAADKAQTTADDAKTAADNAQTAADNAQTAAENAAVNALTDSKAYTDSKHLSLTATITTEWTGEDAPYTQVVAVEGILETDHPHIMPVYSETLETALLEKEAWAMVSDANTADGSITFFCFDEKPETAMNVQIEVNR